MKINRVVLMFIAVLMVSGISHAQTMGEGVACITWPDPTGKPFICASGLTCTAGGPGDLTGICLDLRNDGMNCGGLARMCSAGTVCSGGVCVDDLICDPSDDACFDGMPPVAALHPFRLKPIKITLPVT